MILEGVRATDVAAQHVDAPMPGDFLHLENARSSLGRGGAEPGAQRVRTEHVGVESGAPGAGPDNPPRCLCGQCRAAHPAVLPDLPEHRAFRDAGRVIADRAPFYNLAMVFLLNLTLRLEESPTYILATDAVARRVLRAGRSGILAFRSQFARVTPQCRGGARIGSSSAARWRRSSSVMQFSRLRQSP